MAASQAPGSRSAGPSCCSTASTSCWVGQYFLPRGKGAVSPPTGVGGPGTASVAAPSATLLAQLCMLPSSLGMSAEMEERRQRELSVLAFASPSAWPLTSLRVRKVLRARREGNV